MGNLKEVIYLSNEDYSTLVTNGSVTIDGNTLVYDENSLYITPDQMQMSSTGDMIYSGDNNGTPAILPIGSVGQTLQVWADGLPHWADVSDDRGVTGVTAGAGLNTTSGDTTTDGGTISTSGTLYLTKTAVSPGTYQGITVDKYGRVTGASNANYVTTSDSRLTDSRTPTAHATSESTYGVGTTSDYGHVKIQSGDMSGTSSTNGVAAGLGHTHSNYQAAKPDGTNTLIDSSTSKVSTQYLPDFILGQMIYGGTLAKSGINAVATLTANGKSKLGVTTSTWTLPAAPTSTNQEGIYFIVTSNDMSETPVSGAVMGDWIVASGTTWQKIDNTDAVASVNGKIGVVSLTANDVGALPSSTSIPSSTSDLTNDRFVRYDTNAQGLTNTQKTNVRTNIGAGTSSFSGSYADLTNKPTIDTAVSTSSTNAVQNKAISNYIAARGENLLTNGTAFLQNNYNFSGLTFDASDTYYAGGCFKWVGGRKTTNTDEFMPVDVNQTYEVSYYAKCSSTTSTLYDYFLMYDVDKNIISASHVMWRSGSTTTLAQDLKPEDTKVFLTSIAGFQQDLTQDYRRGLIFWNYVSATGYAYPTETYSRNKYTDLWVDSSAFNTSENSITLKSAWPSSRGTIPAGTPVSQSDDGGTYTYMHSSAMGNTNWNKLTGYMNGVGKNNASGKFREGTAFVKLGWLINQNNESNVTYKLSTLSVCRRIYSGTVTSVRVQATSPVVSSQNAAQTATLNTTISLANAYGDTKNPYGSKTKNYVLAAPTGANGAPSFRALTAADIPALGYMTNPMTSLGDIIYGGANGAVSVLSSSTADYGKYLTLYADGCPHWATVDTGMSNPMTTAGDIIYGGTSGAATRLAKGTARQVLKMNANATAPAWTSQGGTMFRGNAMSFYDGYYLLTTTPSGLGTGDFYLTTSGDPNGSTFSANDLFIIDSFNDEFDTYEATRIGHIGS